MSAPAEDLTAMVVDSGLVELTLGVGAALVAVVTLVWAVRWILSEIASGGGGASLPTGNSAYERWVRDEADEAAYRDYLDDVGSERE